MAKKSDNKDLQPMGHPVTAATLTRELPAYWQDNEGGGLKLVVEDVAQYEADLQAATGVQNSRLRCHLIGQASETQKTAVIGMAKSVDNAASLLFEIAPRNALECLLAVQMAGVHNAAMEMVKRAVHPEQPSQIVDQCVTRANRLTRTFLLQLEALQKLRGQTGQQRVVVEHVTVAAGGQAVIGNVETGGGGRDGA